MKILYFVFSYRTADPWIRSLFDINEHQTFVEYYDLYQAPTDRMFLDAHDRIAPDIVIATLTAGGPFLPSPGTLAKINAKSPVVFMSGDLGDPPWWPYLKEYRDARAFSVAVNFDGNHDWPKEGKDFTALCPISPTYYRDREPNLAKRPIPFGFLGTFASPSRAEILSYLGKHAGLVLRAANNVSAPYEQYAKFMMQCRLVPNVPISGSDAVRQVKARVVEAGLAHCCLLDHVSSKARDWLRPGVDYIEYDTPQQAVTLAKNLLSEPFLMQLCADNLRWRIQEEHSPEIFWGKVFDAVHR